MEIGDMQALQMQYSSLNWRVTLVVRGGIVN
uniref:Uncharacterized protein n=1 Tax=Anguilla anguilla TaxID=7936 RepID=A0A0E9UHD9_ANGAN